MAAGSLIPSSGSGDPAQLVFGSRPGEEKESERESEGDRQLCELGRNVVRTNKEYIASYRRSVMDGLLESGKGTHSIVDSYRPKEK